MTYKRANGTGSVYKISGKRKKPWIAVVTAGWDLDGDNAKQKKHLIGTFKTRNEALIALSEYNRLPYDTDNANMTLAEIYDYWRTHCQTLTPSTMQKYQSAYNSVSQLHDVIYRNIIASQVSDILIKMTYDNQNRVVALFKRLDKEAIILDIPIKNIHISLTTLKKPVRAEKHIFTEKEIDTLWEHSDDWRCQIVLILIYMGWRRLEFETLKKEKTDLENWTITGGMKTAAGTNRIVPIHHRIKPFIQRLYDEAPDGGTLFQLKGKQVSYMYTYRHFYDVMKELDMDHHIHETRHTFRTRLYNAKVETLIIDKLCGHVSGSTGDIVYTHLTTEQLSDAIKKLR